MDHSAEEVIITAGATEALFTALTGIIEPGDEVIIPRPAFVLYEEIVHLCGGRVAALDTSEDDFQIRKERLSPLITERTKAIILNSPNNPTGCVYDLRSLETVRDAVSRNDMFAVCDDVYRQLCYSDDLKSFASYSNESKDLREKIIVVQSFSKPYAMTGWRMGYLMADRSVAERLELIHQFNIVSTPAPFQDACAAALSYDPAEMIETYKERRDYVCSRLDSMGLGCGRPDGAFYVFPSVRKFGITSEEFCRRLITEAGTAVTPGSAFGSDDHIRISYCCSMADLKEGLSRLESFVKKLNGYS